MHRIDTSRAVLSRPDESDDPSTPEGFFSGGIPNVSLATQLDQAWCNAIQENIYQNVLGGGITPTRGPGGDADLLNANKNLHRHVSGITKSATFTPAPSWSYDVHFVYGPPFPSLIRAQSHVFCSQPQPFDAGATWSIQNSILINGVTVDTGNSTLSSMVIGLKEVPAGPILVTSRITTAAPGSTYHPLVQYCIVDIYPWGKIDDGIAD